jgi:glycosyltransferase involved in cell wall biosynthesis
VTELTATVVIPVRDGAGYVARALESVLAQTSPPAVVSVIDDGSRDDTVSVVSRFARDVTLVSTPPHGAAAARNRGICDATTDVVAFLDADDSWPRDRLERHLAIFAANDDADVVLGATRYDGLSPDEQARYRFTGPETVAVVMHLGAATIRRSVFLEHGLLDDSLRLHEDWDWFLRIRERGVRIQVDGAVANLYRRRPESASRVRRPGDPTMNQVLKRSLDRRRAAGATPDPIGPLPLPPPS